MDAHFSHDPAYPASSRQSFTQLPNRSSHPYQQPSQQTSHTLPPLQPQRAALAYANDLFSQSSRSPQASFPATTSTNPYSLYETQGSSRYHGLQPSYSNATQFSNTPNFAPQTSNNLTYPQSHASMLTQGRLPDLLPMPTNGLAQSIGSSMSQAPPHSLASSASPLEDESPPTHVVGAQGRRGILPSAAGRPAAISNGGSPATKQSAAPVKDADGKFPCPHCNKTYLHAKHLKRHLLRHTGDRPYMCFLCRDTFSRSDILKRHFQKCSLRRGNPTGATHLSHSHAHMKKSPHGKKGSISDANEQSQLLQQPMTSSNLDASFGDESVMGLGISGFAEGQHSIPTPGSLSDSMERPGTDRNVQDPRSLTGPGQSTFNRASFTYPQPHVLSDSLRMSTSSTPLDVAHERQLKQFPRTIKPDQINSKPNSQLNGASSASFAYGLGSLPQMNGSAHIQGSSFAWPGAFQLSARDGYTNPLLPSAITSSPPQVKTESENSKVSFVSSADSPQEGLLGGIFDGSSSSTPGGGPEDFIRWNLDQPYSYGIPAPQPGTLPLI